MRKEQPDGYIFKEWNSVITVEQYNNASDFVKSDYVPFYLSLPSKAVEPIDKDINNLLREYINCFISDVSLYPTRTQDLTTGFIKNIRSLFPKDKEQENAVGFAEWINCCKYRNGKIHAPEFPNGAVTYKEAYQLYLNRFNSVSPTTESQESKTDYWKIGDKFTTPETEDKVFTVSAVSTHDVEARDSRSRAGYTVFSKSYINKYFQESKTEEEKK